MSGLANCPDDMTGREIYTRARRTDQIPKKEPDIEFNYLVNWFWELRNYLTDTTSAITPSLILDWVKLLGELPSSDDCAILLSMDSAYRNAITTAISKRNKKNE
jgi:hypothetical protein